MHRLRRLTKLNLRSGSIVGSVRQCAIRYQDDGNLRQLSYEAKPSEIDLQSSLLLRGYAAIKDKIRKGERATFILHIQITNLPDNQLVLSILKEIKVRIWNVEHYFHLGTPGKSSSYGPLMWTSSDVDTVGTMYYCHTSYLLNDGVASHAEQMMASVKRDITTAHPEFGQDWILECFITKPLTSMYPYSPDFALRTY